MKRWWEHACPNRLELGKYIRQIHKDWLPCLENARVAQFPTARLVNDFFHLLEKKGTHSQSWRAAVHALENKLYKKVEYDCVMACLQESEAPSEHRVAAPLAFQERGRARRVSRAGLRGALHAACLRGHAARDDAHLQPLRAGRRDIVTLAALGRRARHGTGDRLWRPSFGSFPQPVAASGRYLGQVGHGPRGADHDAAAVHRVGKPTATELGQKLWCCSRRGSDQELIEGVLLPQLDRSPAVPYVQARSQYVTVDIWETLQVARPSAQRQGEPGRGKGARRGDR